MGGQPAISCRAYAEVYFELLITYCMTAMFFWYLFNLKNRHSFGVYVDGREATEVQMDIGRGLNIHSMASPVKCGGGGGCLTFLGWQRPLLKTLSNCHQYQADFTHAAKIWFLLLVTRTCEYMQFEKRF